LTLHGPRDAVEHAINIVATLIDEGSSEEEASPWDPHNARGWEQRLRERSETGSAARGGLLSGQYGSPTEEERGRNAWFAERHEERREWLTARHGTHSARPSPRQQRHQGPRRRQPATSSNAIPVRGPGMPGSSSDAPVVVEEERGPPGRAPPARRILIDLTERAEADARVLPGPATVRRIAREIVEDDRRCGPPGGEKIAWDVKRYYESQQSQPPRERPEDRAPSTGRHHSRGEPDPFQRVGQALRDLQDPEAYYEALQAPRGDSASAFDSEPHGAGAVGGDDTPRLRRDPRRRGRGRRNRNREQATINARSARPFDEPAPYQPPSADFR
jgi:hypothetical protein